MFVVLLSLAACGGTTSSSSGSGGSGNKGGAKGSGTAGSLGTAGTGGTKGSSSDSGAECTSPASAGLLNGACLTCLQTACEMYLTGCLCDSDCAAVLKCTIACVPADSGSASTIETCQDNCAVDASYMAVHPGLVGLRGCETVFCTDPPASCPP
jgi:hypothetical protein